jgi:signal transduction histidine kinase
MRLPDFARSRVVLAGTAAYTHRGLPDLEAVSRNLADLRRTLTDRSLCGFQPKHCATVENPATPDELLAPLARAAAEASDVLLVYYAGHGLLHGDAGDLHLAVTGSDPDQPWKSAAFEHAGRLISDSEARTKILILDCCYGGRAMRHLMADPARLAVDQVDIEGVFVVTSTSETKRALAPVRGWYTAFTGELLDVLHRGVPSADPLLTANAVFGAVQARMRARQGVPVPQQRARNTAGAIALAHNRWRPPPPTAPPAARPTPAGTSAATGGAPAGDGLAEIVVNLARRSQSLVERQLRILDQLEMAEQDPDQLGRLFGLDHLATRMRRNAENLLVLAGADNTRIWSEPVALSNVVLAAVAEIEDYQRVRAAVPDDIQVNGGVVGDIVHLLAELIENGTCYSPPHLTVSVRAWRAIGGDEPGGAWILIEDGGLGMPEASIVEANERLAAPGRADTARALQGGRLGLVVVANLATRHGIQVELKGAEAGVAAQVWLPPRVIVPAAPVTADTVTADTVPLPRLRS